MVYKSFSSCLHNHVMQSGWYSMVKMQLLAFIISVRAVNSNTNACLTAHHYIINLNTLLFLLTNSEFSMVWYYFIGMVSDHTSIKTLIARLNISMCQCGSIYSVKWPTTAEVLPFLTPISFCSRLPLPFISQRLCSGGLDWECNRFSWNSIFLACWLGYELGRLSWKKGTFQLNVHQFLKTLIAILPNWPWKHQVCCLELCFPSWFTSIYGDNWN